MTDAHDPTALLVARLSDPAGVWNQRVTTRLIEFALSLPVRNLISDADVRSIVATALSESSVSTVIERDVKPGWQRQLERAEQAPNPVGEFLSDAAITEIESLLQHGDYPRLHWLYGAVDPKLLAQLIAPIVQQVLLGFVQKLPGTLGPSSASLMGMFGRGVQQRASALADVGKAMMGGMGVDIEKKLQAAAKDFSQSALATIRDAVRARLSSTEGHALTRRIAQQIFVRIRETELRVIQRDAQRLPIDDILNLVPTIVDHNRARPFIDAAIAQEVAAAFEAIGDQSIGALLSTHGLLTQIEAAARTAVPPTLAQFCAEPETQSLLRALLDPNAK